MHGLELLSNGQASFFSARQPAWHRLGTVTPGAVTAEEALRLANLGGWDVVKRPAMTTAPDGQPVAVPGRYVTVRRNPDPECPVFDALGVVGAEYAVIQNEQAFAFLTDLARDDGAIFETAGSLHGGRQVFVTMRLPEPVPIAGGDELALYVAVTTGHDGAAGFAALPTPVRVVCQNTLRLALRDVAHVQRVRHDARAPFRMRQARRVLEHTLATGAAMQAAAREMLTRPVSDADFDTVVAERFVRIDRDAALRVRRQREAQRWALRTLFRDAKTQEVGRGTAWGAFNAVTEWAEWCRPADALSRGSARSVLSGRGAELRREAFEVFGPDRAAA